MSAAVAQQQQNREETNNNEVEDRGDYATQEEVDENGEVVFKSYEPLFPCQNRRIQESFDKDTFGKHRKAVGEARTVLDTKQPRVYIHQHLKLKKLQLEEERLATIERDNRLLLERIAKIMRTTGSIDNNNMDREIKSSYARNRAILSIERRQRELLRVTQENKAILGRIMSRKSKSEYSRNTWEPKWRKEEYYMAQLSRFQPVSKKTNKSRDDQKERNESPSSADENKQQQQQQNNKDSTNSSPKHQTQQKKK